MRLWHKALIPYLPNAQLLGQHRECAAMRGNGWGRSHSTVNYVWKYPIEYLSFYHLQIIKELEKRRTKTGKLYSIDQRWKDPYYRGKHRPEMPDWGRFSPAVESCKIIGYFEHNDTYLVECISLLETRIKADVKGVYLQEDKERFSKIHGTLVYSKE